MFVGYVRVSSESDRQNSDLQRDALIAVGVDSRNLFEDRASGARTDRPGLTQALAFVRPGDVLVVWKLDRLGRSLTHLIEIVTVVCPSDVYHSPADRWPDAVDVSLLARYARAFANGVLQLANEPRIPTGMRPARHVVHPD